MIPRFDEGAAGYVFGPPKARKSLLLADVALSAVTGTDALGRFVVKQTGSAVGFFAEDAKGETSRRVHRMARARGIEVPPDLKLIDVPALALDNPRHQAQLAATLNGVPGLAFVWLDPMVRLHSVNDNRAEELGPVHTFLRTLSRSCPGTVIALAHHTNKAGGSRGSTDYDAFGDFNLFAEAPDEMTSHVHRIENRGGPPGKPFRFTVEDGYTLEGEPTMRLVVDDVDRAADAAGREDALADTIRSFRAAHPGIAGRAVLEQLRKTGMKVKDAAFWKLWRNKSS